MLLVWSEESVVVWAHTFARAFHAEARESRNLARFMRSAAGIESPLIWCAICCKVEAIRRARVIASVMPESTLPVSGMIQTVPLPDGVDAAIPSRTLIELRSSLICLTIEGL